MQTDEKGAKKAKRTRYWSVMLVGDQGRVIPFRHFKALTVGVGIVLIMSLVALILLGVMFARQRRQIENLQTNLEETSTQTAKFRDEKDLYLTQLIALQKQTGELPQNQTGQSGTGDKIAQPEAKIEKLQKPIEVRQESEEVKKEEPVQKAEPQVRWSAEIRNFNATYDNQQQILKTEFRIYNTSRPKKTLSGRTVVVFKASDDPPIHWVTVPAAPLRDGKPLGNIGKSFKVNNFRTEIFKTLRRNNAAEYDTASIYIFTQQGELIAIQEMPFKVDYSTPEPPKPVEPASSPVQEKTATSAGEQLSKPPVPVEEKPSEPKVPNSGDSQAVPQNIMESPALSSPASSASPLPPEKPQEPQRALDDSNNPEPIHSESTNQTPAAEPAPEGGPK